MEALHPVTVFWRPGCPYCIALKLKLRLARIPFRSVNIWKDPVAADLVRTHNGGNELVPTVRIGSTTLSNPGIAEIRRALAGGSSQATRKGNT